ncbi:MAG: ribonuclease P protein component, partial [Muribaculaceae bacterium]|nr:ribonuclease P protein component [Muribaculaceae bacterium]
MLPSERFTLIDNAADKRNGSAFFVVFFFKDLFMKITFTIKDNKTFVSLYKKGKYTVGKNVAVYYKKNRSNRIGLGIATGKKVGNAVTRSRCRR